LNRPVVGLLIKRYVFQHLVIASFTGLMVLASPIAAAGGLNMLSQRPEAPNFELQDIGGQPHLLSLYRGKVVLLNFWASWCAPCRAEMPSLQRLHDLLKNEDLVILAINIGERKQDIANFYFQIDPPLSFTILMDPDMSASQYWPVSGLPATFLIDRSGRVSYISHGARRWDANDALKVIRDLLQKMPQAAASSTVASIPIS